MQWIRKACGSGRKPDFILFNEFPLTGYSSGSRAEKLKFTIRIPGPETNRIGKAAKECDSYVVFGSYGNIAVSTVQLDPFVFAAYAMRGTEIMLRTATLFSKVDVQAIAAYNSLYSAMSNITFPPESGVPANLGGGSLIVDPRGLVLAEDPSNNDGLIEAEIPIAAFRKGRTIPRYPLELVQPVFTQYRPELPLAVTGSALGNPPPPATPRMPCAVPAMHGDLACLAACHRPHPAFAGRDTADAGRPAVACDRDPILRQRHHDRTRNAPDTANRPAPARGHRRCQH